MTVRFRANPFKFKSYKRRHDATDKRIHFAVLGPHSLRSSSCWSVKHTQTPPFAILAFTLHRIPPLNVPSSSHRSHPKTHANLQLPRDPQPATAAAVAAPPSCHNPSHPHQRQARNALLGQLVLANHTWRLPCLQRATTTDPQKTKLKNRQRKRSVSSEKSQRT